MATLKIHQDVLGYRSGATVDVDGTQSEWLVKEGYASVEGDDKDKRLVTSADAESDPTLAKNREDPDDFDTASTEDDASNDEVSKAKDAAEVRPVRAAGATQKRDAVKADRADGVAKNDTVYDGGDGPTAGPSGIPVDDSAPVPAVANLKDGDAEDDKKASEA